MSTIDRPRLAPLVDGERMSRHEFHERYEVMPPGTKFELIGGVVFMASPVGHAHSYHHGFAMTWMGLYSFRTPGVESYDNGCVALSDETEVQPDSFLRIVPELGQSLNVLGIIHGAPAMVFEVAQSSRKVDLGPKLVEYERSGVLEYVVHVVGRRQILWHVLSEGRFVVVEPDPDGIYRSSTFPGLWLDLAAMLQGDGPALLATLEGGLASAEHAAFVARLAAGRVR